ncbi:phage tail protein [Pedobacter antarcticus]|uniref:phage tail protein n=1 Tax=Pedobacter antarcticus TaxID=34086 RepID=UPI00293125FD|nr:hypothetical protein [Pedobacter antarcticus]
MIYEIKRGNAVLAAVTPTGNREERIMGGDIVNMSFTLNYYVDFLKGDTTVIDGTVFYLEKPSEFEKSGKWSYALAFQSESAFLGNAEMLAMDENNVLAEYDCFYTGTASGALDLIIANANRLTPGWLKGTVDETEARDFNFTGDNCSNALAKIADAFKTEFWIENKKIFLTKKGVDSGLTFRRGKGKGLTKLSRKTLDNKPVTKLIVYGSKQNLPATYPGLSKRLRMPDNQQFILDPAKVEKYGLVEQTLLLDDVYPKRVGTITAITNAFTFSDSTLDFDINNQLIEKVSAKVKFITGRLAGYQFEIHEKGYNHISKTITINASKDERATEIPSETTLKPAVGDKYILTDIIMPLSYVTAAERELKDIATKRYYESADPRVQFTALTDRKYLRDYNISVKLGDFVTIQEPDAAVDKNIRVISKTTSLQDKYDISLELSETVSIANIVKQIIADSNIQKAVNNSKITDAARQRLMWRTTSELSTMLETLRGEMLLITQEGGAYETDIYVETSVDRNPDKFKTTAGRLEHQEYIEQGGAWNVSAFDGVLPTKAAYYVYIKASRTTNAATIVYSLVKIAVESDPANYHLPFGILSSVIDGTRIFSSVRGYTRITGNNITTGIIEGPSGALTINMQTGEIFGRITFRGSNGAVTDIKTVDDVAKLAKDSAAAAQSGANAAAMAALAAQGSANTANSVLADISNDDVLTAGEKQDTLLQWQTIQSERVIITAQASAYSISVAAFNAAYTALNVYITPLLANINVSSNIQGVNFREKFKTYFDARQELLSSVSTAAKSYADQVSNTNLISNPSSTGTTAGWSGPSLNAEIKDFFGVSTTVLKNGSAGDQTALSSRVKVDPAKAYEVTIWLNTPDVGGAKYFGLYAYNENGTNVGVTSITDATGEESAATTNFYFWAGSPLVVDTWTKITGYILPSGFSGTDAKGIGTRALRHAKMFPNTKEISIRWLNYNSATSIPRTMYAANISMVQVSPQAIVSFSKAADAAAAAQSAASAAQSSANLAQNGAMEANSAIADIANDNLLTPGEKQDVLLQWQTIQGEKSVINAQAGAYSLPTSAFDLAYNTLNSYLTPLLSILTSNSVITGNTFRANFKAYYDAKVALLKLVSDKAKALADLAQSAANTAQTAAGSADAKAVAAQGAANAAQTAASNAQGAATTANNLISDIANDNKLTAAEKKNTKILWDEITKEYPTIIAQAVTYGTSTTSYTSFYNALSTYIIPLLANLNVTTDIVGSTMRTNFANYYDAKTKVLKEISDATKVFAQAAANDVLSIRDTRGTNELPGWYYTNYPRRSVVEFKTRATMDVPGSANYGGLTTTTPWVDTSGGAITQQFSSADGVFMRRSSNLSLWGSWLKTEDTESSQLKVNAALTAAQEFAKEVSTSKANAAKADALYIAQGDAKAKADAAQENAAQLSRQLIDNIKVGGTNLFKDGTFKNGIVGTGWTLNGGQASIDTVDGAPALKILSTVHGHGIYSFSVLTIPISANTDYTISFDVRGITYAQLEARIGLNSSYNTVLLPNTNQWRRISYTINSGSFSGTDAFIIYGGGGNQQFYVKNIKVELGNKATSWSPAPEDVQRAIDLVKTTADAAQAASSQLTSTLKQTAYQDIAAWAIGGKAVFNGGMLNVLLLNAPWIQANIVNADYVNTLQLDAGAIKTGRLSADRIDVDNLVAVKLAARFGTIAGFSISDNILQAGGFVLNTALKQMYFYDSSHGTFVARIGYPNTGVPGTNGQGAGEFRNLMNQSVQPVNIALTVEASGAQTNIALDIPEGDIRIGGELGFTGEIKQRAGVSSGQQLYYYLKFRKGVFISMRESF